MFVGRDAESTQLERIYSAGAFHLQLIYGRTRVGKTSFIQRFIADKPCAQYFIAQQNSEQVNLERPSEAIAPLLMGRGEQADKALSAYSDISDAPD